MNKFFSGNWRKLVVFTLLSVLGGALIVAHNKLNSWESPQVVSYNKGVEFFKQGKADEAMVEFDKSLDAYRAGRTRSGLDRFIYPTSSTELAALAEAKKATLFMIKQKPELAINSLKESIKYNGGGEQFYLNLPPERIKFLAAEYGATSQEDTKRLEEQALVAKHNLDLFFKKNPSMAQGEGKGKGNGKGKPRPGNKPAPGQEPSDGKEAGKNNRDDI